MDTVDDAKRTAEFGSGYGLYADVLSWTVICSIAYLIVHNFLDLSRFNIKRSVDLDVRNRVIAAVHGLVGFIQGCRVALLYGHECGADTQPKEYDLLVFSCGYFIYD